MFAVLPEARRLAYLEVLGVESYFPRLLLPGAKPSILCETLPAVEALAIAAEPAPANDPVPKRATGHDALRALLPNIAGAKKPALRKPANIAAAPATPKPEVVRFNLRFFQVPGLAMIVDGSPDSAPEPAIQRFAANLLLALASLNESWEGAIKTNLAQHLFRWPVVGNTQVAQDEQAAREAVTASVSANRERHAIPLILLMGDPAVQYAAGDYPGARVLSVASVSHYLNTPLDKRTLWQTLLASQ